MTPGADDQPPREGLVPAERPRRPRSGSSAPPPSATPPVPPNAPRKQRRDGAPRPPARPAPDQTEPPGPPGPGNSQRTMVIVLSVLTAVVLGIIIFAVTGSGSDSGSTGTGPPTATILPPADASTTVPAEQLTSFSDTETGFSVKYPKSWQKIGSPVRDLRLALDAGGGAGLSIRVDRTEQPTTPANIVNLEAFTQASVNLNPSAKIVKKEQTTVNGMPAYYYLYTFRDDETGQEGVHAHYFIFQGRKMNVLVFQVLAADSEAEFNRLASTFDQIISSFHSDPDLAPSTTVAATTTTAGG